MSGCTRAPPAAPAATPAAAAAASTEPAAAWARTFVAVSDVPNGAVEDGAVVVLDARKPDLFRKGHIPGARRVEWERWRKGLLIGGELPDDLDKVARELAALGVDERKRVLVCGAALADGGWGEDGRVAWLLRYLGHPATAVLDGGCDAWKRAGRAWVTSSSPPAPPGTFRARPREALRARHADVMRAVALQNEQLADAPVIVDVRSLAEYEGANLYWEKRGGRIPGAIHLSVNELVLPGAGDDGGGRLRPASEIRELLRARGVGVSGSRVTSPLIVYCTGGVRSALATLAFEAAGAKARNYDGSFWQWADDDALPVERGPRAR